MHNHRIPLLIVLLAALGSGVIRAQTKPQRKSAGKAPAAPARKYDFVQSEVGDRRAALRQRWRPDAEIGLYTPDAVLLAPDGRVIEGRDAVQKFWRDLAGRGVRTVALSPFNAYSSTDAGYEIGRYEITFARDGGEPVTIKGTYLAGLKRDASGVWHVMYDAFTAEQPYPSSSS